ncbi:unnamed protein product [Moneuplotes crassus]|uniref:Uncharacterized protein n=1 Tax=Euplotes crassus TaxID=5936 RepID=A0AAD1UA14_EUPCR|nr:unnamed protein product [Moneuplotes crassus]
MEKHSLPVEEKKAEIASLEESILSKSKELNYKRCCNAYYNIFAAEIGVEQLGSCTQKKFFKFLFENKRFIKLAQKLGPSKFFNLNSLMIRCVQEKNREIINFIDFLFPNKVNTLWVYSSLQVKRSTPRYINSIIRLSSRVTQSVILDRFCLNSNQFKRLITSFRHVKGLAFNFKTISIQKVPNFSRALKNSKIQELTLWRSGIALAGNCDENIGGMINLIKGLASCSDLKSSLKKITIRCHERDKNEVINIFKGNQFERLQIIFGS